MSNQGIAIIINLFIILVALLGTFALVKKLKFKDNTSRIIFLLYILYWIPPLMCRDYTTAVNVHLDLGDNGYLLWVPVIAFGVIGILWRPLNDILTYRTKSRKFVIYISLLVQFATILPFMLYPCFATNVIQSVGTGVGASGIGLFTLMFNENQDKYKKFLTLSIFALPPVIAGFIVSAIESFVASFVQSAHTNAEYIDVIWYIWLLALVFIIASFILVTFVKERRETLYQDNKYKQPIVKKQGHWKMVLLCICAVCLSFFRWSTAGPFSGLQLTYIGLHYEIDTGLWEGYLALNYSFGCLIGSIISASAVLKCKTDKYQPIVVGIAIAVWLLYLGINVASVNVPTYFFTTIINGIGFGLLWTIFMHIVLNKFYFKQNIITPIGVFNMSLSIGICLGSLFVGLAKYLFYDFHGITKLVDWNDYILNNYVTSGILAGILLFFGSIFAGYYVIEYFFKEKMLKVNRKIATIGENEL